MPTNYRTYVGKTLPTWLLSKWGGRVAATIALTYDMLGDMTLEAVKARFMDSDTFPNDALRLIGSERMISQITGESNDAYKARLKNAWRAWSEAGTESSVLGQLEALGLTATLHENFDWDWDSQPDNWSRFWVVIHNPAWTRKTWGDGHKWGDGTSWGSTAAAAEIRGIRGLVRQWKPGHTICVNVIMVFDAGDWATDSAAMSGDWDELENRSEAAIYCDGTNSP